MCSLAHLNLLAPGRALAVPLSNRVLGRKSRYRSPALSTTLPGLLDLMASPAVALVAVTKGGRTAVDDFADPMDGTAEPTAVLPMVHLWAPGRTFLIARFARLPMFQDRFSSGPPGLASGNSHSGFFARRPTISFRAVGMGSQRAAAAVFPCRTRTPPSSMSLRVN